MSDPSSPKSGGLWARLFNLESDDQEAAPKPAETAAEGDAPAKKAPAKKAEAPKADTAE